jgi:hypothetical protein
MLTFPPAAREDNLDHTQLVQATNSFSQAIFSGFTQAGNVAPLPAVSQNVPVVFAQFAFNRTNRKPPIRLAYADIMPFLLFAGINYFGAQIEGIKQDSNPKLSGQAGFTDGLGCQFGKFAEGDFYFPSMFFLNIQPRTPGDGNSMIIQTNLYDSMAGSIFAGGVVTQFAYCFHFLCPLERLGIIDDEKQIKVFSVEQTKQHIQSNLLHYNGLIPDATPVKLAMVGSMCRVTQGFSQTVYGCSMADGDGHYQSPKVFPRSCGEMLTKRLEKTLEFFRNFADCNHMASPAISFCFYHSYRQSRPFLFDVFGNHKFNNRSV